MTTSGASTERGGARIAVSDLGDVVRISGVLRDADAESWIWPIFELVHYSASRSGLSEIVLDLSALEYANASAWRCIVLWLRLLHDDPGARYRLRIKSQPAFLWQRVAIPALVVFGKDRLVF